MEKIKKNNLKLIMAGVVILLVIMGSIVYNALTFQTTDDAYVENLNVQLAPKVRGEIVNVYVEDNQFVQEGDLIAKIDDKDYIVAYNMARAQYERALYNQTNAKANYKATESELKVAKTDVERYQKLYTEGAVSKQTLDNAIAKYDSITARNVSANQSVVSETENKVANAEIEALKAQAEQAKLNLSYTEIRAPQSGTVTNKRISKGSYVQAGSPVMNIVPKEVWVVANYKENQVGKMREGQEVLIKIDSYPNKTFKGKIDSIQRLTGAKSSLFPPENAVGSFVKIVQRIPVKIVFDEEIDTNKYNIIPGMSVVPKVRVR